MASPFSGLCVENPDFRDSWKFIPQQVLVLLASPWDPKSIWVRFPLGWVFRRERVQSGYLVDVGRGATN